MWAGMQRSKRRERIKKWGKLIAERRYQASVKASVTIGDENLS